MSSLALMRWLESAPERYDAGLRAITLGRAEALHRGVAEAAAAEAGARVLELGCGTGAVTERLVARGAQVTALDQNPEMLERARARLAAGSSEAAGALAAGPPEVVWLERTAAEIDALPEHAFDAVAASLCMSEMSASERAFVLREARRRLAPGGRLVVADEVWPDATLPRMLFAVLRGPQALLGWLLAGSISHPVADLVGEVRDAGFRVVEEQRWLLRSLALVVARDAAEGSPS